MKIQPFPIFAIALLTLFSVSCLEYKSSFQIAARDSAGTPEGDGDQGAANDGDANPEDTGDQPAGDTEDKPQTEDMTEKPEEMKPEEMKPENKCMLPAPATETF